MQTIPVIDISRKPKPLEPCNQCGYCCTTSACAPGATLVYGVKYAFEGIRLREPCKALMPLGEHKYGCGLIINPDQWIHNGQTAESNSEAIKIIIGAGITCNSYEEISSHKARKKIHKKIDQTMMAAIKPKQFQDAWRHIFPEFR